MIEMNMQKALYMKKLSIIILTAVICLWALTGCAGPASSEVTGTPLPTPIPTPVPTPVPTTAPEPTPQPTLVTESMDDDMQPLLYNGWIYYLDINDPVVTSYNEDPPLRMKKEDGSGEAQLGIRGFHYDIIGDYVYVDSNDPDADENGTQTWSTARLNPDGSGKVRLEYRSMSLRFIPEGSDRFYFTTLGDCAVYVSDLACENVRTLLITLPDKGEIERKLGSGKVMQLNLTGLADGGITFDVSVSAADGTLLYKGGYKTTMDGVTTEKTDKGEFYKYSADKGD